MSLKPTPIGTVPELTAYVAHAAFPGGNPYLSVRDTLGTFYDDPSFAGLFPARGQPAETPWRLALVTVLQFAEGLSDRQAADAVRSRIDWKYALGLELTDPGFDFSVLCEFRSRLLAGDAGRLLLEAMLETCKGHGLVKARTRQRTDSTHVLAAIRTLNRLELVGETLRATLNSLATVEPDWLRSWAPPEWFDRYSARIEESRLPKGEEARYAHGEAIGTDGFRLLEAVYGEAALSAKGLQPGDHLVDAGYVDGELLVDSQAEHGVRLVGPVRRNVSWQAKAAGGFDISHFAIDWEAKRVTCPEGKTSVLWQQGRDRWGNEVVHTEFSRRECLACGSRPLCTRARTEGREMTLRPRERHEALQAARVEQETGAWKTEYARRAGIEGTISEGVRGFGLRRCRYIGLGKAHLQHVITAAAMNLSRLAAWLAETPREKTRVSQFARLALAG